MVTVKLIVLLFLVLSCVCCSNYCKICTNHTLCRYSTPGPGVSCKEYDRNKFLTDDDIYDLVNQINERRNFIALGNSRLLPSAANMNKLVWSEELATFAQRWADQCDPSLRPDKEDQCRDMENTEVGQNIASIINPSARFNVKSFIEMWFMQSLDYKSSVTYYDNLQDYYNSNYFTQLIWAETENVGCGRAKFKVRNITVDRLVCNFAPKGNIHGKPVYIIGFPRTQCRNKETGVDTFKGLCTRPSRHKAKIPATNLPVSSLLKILNLSNDSVKQEIDPIYNNMKQIIPHRNEMERPKHPIMRHIFGNKLQAKRPDYPQREGHNFWISPLNVSRNNKEHFHNREKVYPRLDHSHVYKYTGQSIKSNQMNDFRKHVTPIDSYDNYGNSNNFKNKCTRRTETQDRDCENHSKPRPKQKYYQCTRGLKTNWEMLQNTKNSYTNPNDLCPCSSHAYTAYPSTNTQRLYTLNCECGSANGITIRCPNLLRTPEDNARYRATSFESDIPPKDTYLNPEDEYEWLFNKRRKKIPRNEEKISGYIYTNRNRYRRDFGDSSSLKPFWQIDGFSYNENPQLKALRYTTLPNKRQRNSRRYSSKSFTTESITIKLKNTHLKPVTEKYLSFDELLHLRKFNLSSNNAQRRMEPTTTAETEPTTANTTEYTTNTPFVRMKHCTRKLTCTWTAASLTDSNGSIVGHIDHGSRTPPGYVEGCTRTSTCTRDFMNRNKFPTTEKSTNDGDVDDDETTGDSDYCERRSLNLRKRNSYEKRSPSKICQKEASNTSTTRFSYSDNKILSKNNFRRKRNLAKHKRNKNNLSYGDLYYLVLNKIVKNWENSKTHDRLCACNETSEVYFIHYFIIFLGLIYFLLT